MEQPSKKQALESSQRPVAPARPPVPDQVPRQSTVTVQEIDDDDDDELEDELEDELDGDPGEPEGDDDEAYFESILDEMEELMNEQRDGTEFVVRADPEIKREIQSCLQRQGPLVFMQKYVLQPQPDAPLAQILACLGFQLLVDKAESHPQSRLAVMVQVAMKHFMSQRERLDSPRTLDDLAACIQRCSNIIVLSGAGISTSLGIPDFRSDDGLYAQLKHLGLADPQDVFDIEQFRQDPSIFYTVAAKILPEEKKYTPTHKFIRLLQDHGKLLRNYTQNIDNLEVEAGIKPEKLVQCHGSFGMAYCFSCFKKIDGKLLYPDIRAGRIPRCEPCTAKGKKLEAQDHEIPDSFGVYKPEITFFGESLPSRFEDLLIKGGDAHRCDLLICIGTSLKVAPVSSIAKVVGRDVPQVYISKTPVRQTFEMSLLGPCDDVVELLCQKLGWKLKHEMARRAKMADKSDDSKWPDGFITSSDGVYEFDVQN